MRFYVRKRRQAPAVIIVALIDILIVLLIYLMVTTTFRQQPALKLALPVSSHAEKTGLATAAQNSPDLKLAINADTKAPFGQVIIVMDAARDAKIKIVSAFTKE